MSGVNVKSYTTKGVWIATRPSGEVWEVREPGGATHPFRGDAAEMVEYLRLLGSQGGEVLSITRFDERVPLEKATGREKVVAGRV